jgi:mannose-6-phosphate isomerase
MTTLSERPHKVGANKIPLYYAGGERIDRFRGEPASPGPEDWVGSVTAIPPEILPDVADPTVGISRLADGTSLSGAIEADPAGWLGVELAEAFGGEPGLLVKLLDAGERLPVHCHPTREVARAELGSPFGKTEGWIVLEAEPAAAIWLGFRETVEIDELRRWVDEQSVAEMLAAMNRLEVSPGDVFYLPAGLPHSIGEGIMITELQEPTSFSILAEYRSFGLDEGQATLGLGWERALACFDLSGYSGERLARLVPPPELVHEEAGGSRRRLFPVEAEEFFQAIRARATGELALGPAGFCVLVVEQGSGRLAWSFGDVDVRAGETWVVPAGAGPLSLHGSLEAIVCKPPASDASKPKEELDS